MKKKIVSVFLTTAMVFSSLVGCGGNSVNTSTTTTAAKTPAATTVAATTKVASATTKAATQTTAAMAKGTGSANPADYKVVMVVKQSDSWFDDMATGVEQLKKDTGLNCTVQVPETGDAASQIAIMEDLIAQKVNAICVVPNDPQALVPTIEKARAAGITVVTHEAPGTADKVDLDVEAFHNEDFGKLMGENLAKAMGGKGKYAGFVGGLTMQTHMTWFNSAVSYIKEKYPDMTLVATEPYEDKNSVEGAHDKTLEILKAYPDIKGLFDCSAHGGGICEALTEKNKVNDVAVVSLALPSMSATYLKDGSMKHGQAWRPADAGYATCYAAYLIASKQGVKKGTDLKATGYNSVDFDKNIAYGNAPLEFTADNVDDYSF